MSGNSRMSFDSSMDNTVKSEMSTTRIEVMWNILENILMGSIPEHIKSCLIKNGFTSLKIIAQINPKDITNFSESLAREPCNGVTSLKPGDRKLLSYLPELIQENQEDLNGQWRKLMGGTSSRARSPILPINAASMSSPHSPHYQPVAIADVTEAMRTTEDRDVSGEIDSSESDAEESSDGTPEERRHERILKHRLNRLMKVTCGDPAPKVKKVVLRFLDENTIRVFCICPMCEKKSVIDARKLKSKEVGFGVHNFKRHFLHCHKKYRYRIPQRREGPKNIRENIDQYWIEESKYDPLSSLSGD